MARTDFPGADQCVRKSWSVGTNFPLKISVQRTKIPVTGLQLGQGISSGLDICVYTRVQPLICTANLAVSIGQTRNISTNCELPLSPPGRVILSLEVHHTIAPTLQHSACTRNFCPTLIITVLATVHVQADRAPSGVKPISMELTTTVMVRIPRCKLYLRPVLVQAADCPTTPALEWSYKRPGKQKPFFSSQAILTPLTMLVAQRSRVADTAACQHAFLCEY